MARRSTAVMERAAATAAEEIPFVDDDFDENARDERSLTIVDGREAHIVQDRLVDDPPETLEQTLELLEKCRGLYDVAVCNAKDAISYRKSMQDSLAYAVDRVIAARDRERQLQLGL